MKAFDTVARPCKVLSTFLLGAMISKQFAKGGTLPEIEWQKSHADTNSIAKAFRTKDKGIFVAGLSGVNLGGFGSYDYWALDLDARGNLLWQKYFGGTGADFLGGHDTSFIQSAYQTSDGGFILGGDSTSTVSGNKTSSKYGGQDFWLVKTDALGAKVWENSFGGLSNDLFNSVRTSTDGGFLVCGETYSGVEGNKATGNFGSGDYWILKLNANGGKVWESIFGGTARDALLFAEPIQDGGCILAGYSGSGIGGNKTVANFGSWNFWLIKVDRDGKKVWEKVYGGTGTDLPNNLLPTPDGGFIITGVSNSAKSGNKNSDGFGLNDFWLVRIDSNGNKLWDRSFGGSATESSPVLLQTPDGGFLVGGQSASGISGNKTTANFGSTDYWVIKLDGNGDKIWEQDFGGSGQDILSSLQTTSDGGYLLGGTSTSGISGNKTTPAFGPSFYWIVKITSAGEKDWEGSFGGGNGEGLTTTFQTEDEGFVLVGESRSGIGGNKTTPEPGCWIIKLKGNSPVLISDLSEGKLVISWPDWASQYSLESKPAFSPGFDWATVAIGLTNKNATNYVAIPPALESQFFRLRGD